MSKSELETLAREIIKNNIYLTLGTADKVPWVAPLFYCVSDNFTFYFISQLDSLHTKQMLKNSKVAFSIFDSHAEEGKGTGVQATGNVQLIREEDLLKEITNYQTNFIKISPEVLSGNAPYRLFKLTVIDVWVTDPDAKVDKRVKVELRT
jgi:uncharacterized protein YhbP (UPF0306 family)